MAQIAVFFRDLQDGRTSFVLQEQKKKEEGLPRIKNVPRRSSAAARARLPWAGAEPKQIRRFAVGEPLRHILPPRRGGREVSGRVV